MTLGNPNAPSGGGFGDLLNWNTENMFNNSKPTGLANLLRQQSMPQNLFPTPAPALGNYRPQPREHGRMAMKFGPSNSDIRNLDGTPAGNRMTSTPDSDGVQYSPPYPEYAGPPPASGMFRGQNASYGARPSPPPDETLEPQSSDHDYAYAELAAIEKHKRGQTLDWAERQVISNLYENADPETRLYLSSLGLDSIGGDAGRLKQLEESLAEIEAMPDGPEKARRLEELKLKLQQQEN